MAEPNAVVEVGGVRFGNALPLALIAGPCQMESRDHAFDMAGALKEHLQPARDRARLQDELRQGEPHEPFRQARRSGSTRRLPSSPTCARSSVCRC